jgi:MFS family permease
MSDMASKTGAGARIGASTWYALVALGLSGQLAWAIENQFMNTFVYDRITPDPRPIAWMVAASAITAALTSILMGALSDRTRARIGRRKPYILFGYLVWGLSTGLFVTSAHLRPVALAAAAAVVLDCVMTFFGSTANDAAFNAWIVDATDEGNRGKVVAVQSLLAGAAMLVVYGGAGFAIKAWGYEGFFGAIGAVVIVAGLSGGLAIKERPAAGAPEGGYWKGIAKAFAPGNVKGRGELLAVLLAQAVLGIGLQVFFPYLLIYIQHYIALDATVSTILMAVAILVGGIAAAIPAGILADRFGRRPVTIVGIVVQALGLLLFSLFKGFAALLLTGIAWVSAQTFQTVGLGAWNKDLLPEGERGQYTGISLIFTVALPMVIGPMIGSALIGRFGIPTVIDGKPGAIPTPVIFQAGAALTLVGLWPVLSAGRIKDL